MLADQMNQTAQIVIEICFQNTMKILNRMHHIKLSALQRDTTLIGSIQQIATRDSISHCHRAKVQHSTVAGLSYTAWVAERNACQNVTHYRFLFCAEQKGQEIVCFSLDGNETKTSEYVGNNTHTHTRV